jgi:hypothetical protein
MSRGGSRPGAGRKRGTVNKRSAKLQSAMAASGLDPMEFLLSAMANEKLPAPLRLDAAKAVLPFLHARLSIQATVNPAALLEPPADPIDTAKRVALLLRLATNAIDAEVVTETPALGGDIVRHTPEEAASIIYDNLHSAQHLRGKNMMPIDAELAEATPQRRAPDDRRLGIAVDDLARRRSTDDDLGQHELEREMAHRHPKGGGSNVVVLGGVRQPLTGPKR